MNRIEGTPDSLELINSKTRIAYNLVAQKYHDLFHNELEGKEYDRRLLDAFAKKFNRDSLICDAGCGPSGHIGRYMFEKGLHVIGIDISDKCVELARRFNPGMTFAREDIGHTSFHDGTFDGILSYYSILDTPRSWVQRIFGEFSRILKPNGYVLVAAKSGTTEGYAHDLLGIPTEIYVSMFTKEEIIGYFEQSGFVLESVETRNPYDCEIQNERIFAVGQKGDRQSELENPSDRREYLEDGE